MRSSVFITLYPHACLSLSVVVWRGVAWRQLAAGVNMRSKVMTEEIFGPLLPVLSFTDLDQVIDHVNAGEKPLT